MGSEIIRDRALLKKLTVLLSVSLAVLYSLYSLVLCPLYLVVYSNYIYATSILPNILEIILSFTDMLGMVLGAAVTVFIYLRISKKGIIAPSLITLAGITYKHILNSAFSWFSEGLESANQLGTDLMNALLLILLDALTVGLMILAGCLACRKASAPECFPYKKLIDFSNPVMISALWCGIIISASLLINRAFYDIKLSFYGGVPEDFAEVMIMIVYYLSDILAGIIFYFISILIYMRFDIKDRKIQAGL